MMNSGINGRIEMVNFLQDAISSLITSVESGFGFDHAMYQYSQEADNELSQAFMQVLEEIGSGVQRQTAMRNMAERIDAVEVTEFVEAIIRANEEGISILEMLKEQLEQIGGSAGA